MTAPRLITIAALTGLTLSFAGCSTQSRADEAAAVRPAKERKKAPAFKLKDSDGKEVSLADYKGKAVLLNFWATWCGPCKIEIPWFVEFESKYRDKGFAVLGVAMDEEGWEVIKPYITEKKVNYRVLAGDDSTAELYGGVESLPTTFLIDKNGMIAGVHVGLVSKGDYEKDIQTLLNTAAGQ